MPRSIFLKKVIYVVSLIPYGKVVSYGQVALMIGIPRAARFVGGALNSLEDEVKIPWWRVINNSGKITIKGSIYTADDQKVLLEEEGIEVDNNYNIDIEKYRFIPDKETLNKIELPEYYIERILKKYKI